MGDKMVIRFSVHKFFVFLGLSICIISVANGIQTNISKTTSGYATIIHPLIIDAGHGGADGGAVGADGTPESHINLQIADRLNLLGKLCGISTVMTRSTEDISYPVEAKTIAEKKIADQKARLRLIQDYPNGILYSIHQNSFPSKTVSGNQVLYGHTESSQMIGILLQNQLNDVLQSESKRVAAEISNDIYLMKHCQCTAVLIECGFISNPNECKLLQSAEYQKTLATIMLGVYLQYLDQ